ncbi:hypothetical protein FNV43_RR13496 [Rhamnella rubrinervis]|uniref:C2 domain-containing protein n=1 Tax=Rhamnella rubrinervis TaxID=2594499 RepID=A0A8K0H147_9ROSA|nr:hypothetical protein FNV43_RR13496 [Rhamnella rubrinervis]
MVAVILAFTTVGAPRVAVILAFEASIFPNHLFLPVPTLDSSECSLSQLSSCFCCCSESWLPTSVCSTVNTLTRSFLKSFMAVLQRWVGVNAIESSLCFATYSESVSRKCFGSRTARRTFDFGRTHVKKLDFKLKIIGGDISSIPAISDAFEETIRDALEDSITWPVRKIVPILPGDYSDLDLKPVGTLEVKLVQAKNLTNKDLVGKSDPYAVICIRPLRDRIKTSKTISNQLNPIWNEHFEFIAEDVSTQHLTVRISDDEGVQASELIGYAHVALKDLIPGKVKDVWVVP